MLRFLLVTSDSKNYRCHTDDRCATLARSYALSVPARGTSLQHYRSLGLRNNQTNGPRNFK
jgi:hypothetical protein